MQRLVRVMQKVQQTVAVDSVYFHTALSQHASGRKKDISMDSIPDLTKLVYCICIDYHACQKNRIWQSQEIVRLD